jgi:hypothetical protein
VSALNHGMRIYRIVRRKRNGYNINTYEYQKVSGIANDKSGLSVVSKDLELLNGLKILTPY